jgi:hypothetical protein
MGPVERAVRLAMSNGRSMLRSDAAAHGTLGLYHFDRLVNGGIAKLENGRYSLVTRPAPDRSREIASLENYRRQQEEIQARNRAERAAREDRERLFAGLNEYRTDERPMVVAEREQAIRESQSILGG